MRRVRKDGADHFTLLVASASSQSSSFHEISILDKKAKLSVQYGDFAEPLQRAVAALGEVNEYYSVITNVLTLYQAKKYAANAHQVAMLEQYIESSVHCAHPSLPDLTTVEALRPDPLMHTKGHLSSG